jgi:hypothetical protein
VTASPGNGRSLARDVSPREELLYLVGVAGIMVGLFVDGWAHYHLDTTNEGFITIWHALLYGAFAATALLLGVFGFARRVPGGSWRDAVAPGYGYAVAGAFVFAAGGVADFAWHSAFGVERGIEVLVSPTHLVLVSGLAAMLAAPFRARLAMLRADAGAGRGAGGDAGRDGGTPEPSRARSPWPAILCVVLVVGVIDFMTQFANPLIALFPSEPKETSQPIGIGAMLVQSGIIAGAFVLLARSFRPLPIGAVGLLLVLPALGMSLMSGRWLAAAVAAPAAVIVEVILAGMVLARPAQLRIASGVLLVVLWAAYIVAIGARHGLTWSVHVWSGAILLGGLVGWLVAYVGTQPDRGDTQPDPGER